MSDNGHPNRTQEPRHVIEMRRECEELRSAYKSAIDKAEYFKEQYNMAADDNGKQTERLLAMTKERDEAREEVLQLKQIRTKACAERDAAEEALHEAMEIIGSRTESHEKVIFDLIGERAKSARLVEVVKRVTQELGGPPVNNDDVFDQVWCYRKLTEALAELKEESAG